MISISFRNLRFASDFSKFLFSSYFRNIKTSSDFIVNGAKTSTCPSFPRKVVLTSARKRCIQKCSKLFPAEVESFTVEKGIIIYTFRKRLQQSTLVLFVDSASICARRHVLLISALSSKKTRLIFNVGRFYGRPFRIMVSQFVIFTALPSHTWILRGRQYKADSCCSSATTSITQEWTLLSAYISSTVDN